MDIAPIFADASLRRRGRPVICFYKSVADRGMATRVLRERILGLSWGSALLLQIAEPRIAQGVADHSVFVNNPSRRLARLYSTANTMLDLLVGAPADMRAAAARIDAIHDRVNGLTPERQCLPYSAHDPELLAWVHVALHVTLLKAYAALIGPLSCAEQDRYCCEVASIEPLLGIPTGRLPRDARSLRCEFDARLHALAVGANARRIARGILQPSLPAWAAPARGIARLCTIGFLPEPVRAAYALRFSVLHAAAFRMFQHVSRVLLPRIPEHIRFAPPELMLRWCPRDQ